MAMLVRRRRVFRKRPQLKRKPLKKVIARAMIKASTGTTKRGPLHYHMLRYVGDVRSVGNANGVGNIPLDPSQHPRWQTFTTLYDQYKIIGATVTIVPRNTTNMTTTSNAGAYGYTMQQSTIYYKFDKDDNDNAVNEDQCIQENWAYRRSFKAFSIKIGLPKFAQYTNEDGGLMVRFGYHSCQDNPVVQDGFLKYFQATPPDDLGDDWITGFKYIVKLVVAFRDYASPAQQEVPKVLNI